MTTEEWNLYFAGHWHFPGEKQRGHLASFPLELPRRLIKMFSFPGETVLDPFAGAATTIRAAMELGRVGVGYEINRDFEGAMRARLGLEDPNLFGANVQWLESKAAPFAAQAHSETATKLEVNPKTAKFGSVVEAQDLAEPARAGRAFEARGFAGLFDFIGRRNGRASRRARARGPRRRGRSALEKLLRNRGIFAREAEAGAAYLHLDNKTFVNAKMIRLGLCEPDGSDHRLAKRFEKIFEAKNNG